MLNSTSKSFDITKPANGQNVQKYYQPLQDNSSNIRNGNPPTEYYQILNTLNENGNHSVTSNKSTQDDIESRPRTLSFSLWPDHHIQKKLGIGGLAILTFYSVCGGPFGIEAIVAAGGPKFALLGFTLMIVWAIPEALITAELSTTFPGSSGSVAWVEAAFGPFWAFQKGWLSWFSGVSDNALYPILFYDCFMHLLTVIDPATNDDTDGSWYDFYGNTTVRFIFLGVVTALLTLLNLKGLDVVGNVSIVICALSLLPFVVFCIMGAPKVNTDNWFQGLSDRDSSQSESGTNINWRLLLNTFFWNINYWESAACFSGDVKDPASTYPWGMLIAVILVFISTFIPVLVGIGVSDAPFSDWTDGYFVHLGGVVGGYWLGRFMLIGSAIANVGMFEAEMSSDAWQICGMAESGTLPKVLATRNTSGVPVYGVLMSASGVMLIVCMTFTEVMDIMNMMYCLGQLIEFIAFLHLRYRYPHLDRPYKVPINFFGMFCLLLLPIIFIFVIMSFSSLNCLLISFLMAIFGVFAYYFLNFIKDNKWCEFNDVPVHYEIIASLHKGVGSGSSLR